jgi:hypothetical protein
MKLLTGLLTCQTSLPSELGLLKNLKGFKYDWGRLKKHIPPEVQTLINRLGEGASGHNWY